MAMDPYSPEGCFIATAAYGTETHYKIDLLRNFRDDYLKGRKEGEWFIENYYRYSPRIAKFIASNKLLKESTRLLFVEPIYRVVKKLFYD